MWESKEVVDDVDPTYFAPSFFAICCKFVSFEGGIKDENFDIFTS